MKNYDLQNMIPNKLKECRVKAGMTQFDVMLKLGVRSTDRISKWERGTKYPNVVNLLRLAQIYNVLPGELYPEINQEFLDSQKLPEDLPHE
jgi:transcriptional regulator with XRE-family HTH domain